MHHAVNPVSIRLGKVFNWKSEWSLYNKFLYLQYVRLNFFLFNYLNIWTNLRSLLVRYSLIVNSYKIFLIDTNRINIAVSYFNVETFVLPNLPLELTEVHRHLIQKEWGTISSRSRQSYKEFLNLKSLTIFNNNRLFKYKRIWQFAQLLFRDAYTLNNTQPIYYAKQTLTTLTTILFPLITYLKPFLTKRYFDYLQDPCEWFFFKGWTFTQNTIIFKLISLINYKFCYFNLFGWVSKSVLFNTSEITSKNPTITLPSNVKLTTQSTLVFFLRQFSKMRSYFFRFNPTYFDLNFCWYLQNIGVKKLPHTRFVIKSSLLEYTKLQLKKEMISFFELSHKTFDQVTSASFITPRFLCSVEWERIAFGQSYIKFSQINQPSTQVRKLDFCIYIENWNQLSSILYKFLVQSTTFSQTVTRFTWLYPIKNHIIQKTVSFFSSLYSLLQITSFSNLNLYLSYSKYISPTLFLHCIQHSKQIHWVDIASKTTGAAYSVTNINIGKLGHVFTKIYKTKYRPIYLNFLWKFNAFCNIYLDTYYNIKNRRESQISFIKTFHLKTLLTSDVSITIQRAQRMHSRFSVGTEATSLMAATHNFFSSRYLKLTLLKLQNMCLKSISSHNQKSLASYQHKRINLIPKSCFSLLELFNQHSSCFYEYLIRQVFKNFKQTISKNHKDAAAKLNSLVTKILYSGFLLSKNKLFITTQPKSFIKTTRLFKTKFLNFISLIKTLTQNNKIHPSVAFLKAEDLYTEYSSNLGVKNDLTRSISDFEEPSKIWAPTRFLKNYFLTYKKFSYGYNDNCFQLFLKWTYKHYNIIGFKTIFNKYQNTFAWQRVLRYPVFKSNILGALQNNLISENKYYYEYLRLAFKPPTKSWLKIHTTNEIDSYDFNMFTLAFQRYEIDFTLELEQLYKDARLENYGKAFQPHDYNLKFLFTNNPALISTLSNQTRLQFSELQKYIQLAKIQIVWGQIFNDCFLYLKLIYLYYFLKFDLEILYKKLVKDFGHFRISFQNQSWYANQLTASFIGEYIKFRLLQTYNINYIYSSLERILKESFGIIGYKISVSGRLSRAQRAKVHTTFWGQLNPNMVETQLSYAYVAIRTKYGVCGIKVWINHRVTRKEYERIYSDIYVKVNRIVDKWL